MNSDLTRFARPPAALTRLAAVAVLAFFAVPGIFTGADHAAHVILGDDAQ